MNDRNHVCNLKNKETINRKEQSLHFRKEQGVCSHSSFYYISGPLLSWLTSLLISSNLECQHESKAFSHWCLGKFLVQQRQLCAWESFLFNQDNIIKSAKGEFLTQDNLIMYNCRDIDCCSFMRCNLYLQCGEYFSSNYTPLPLSQVFSRTCQHLLQLFLSVHYMLKVSMQQTPGLLSSEDSFPIVDMVHSAFIYWCLFHFGRFDKKKFFL